MTSKYNKMILYKHIRNTDVAFEILSKFYIKEKDTLSLKVRWWNVTGRQYNRSPQCMGIVERIEIPREKFRKEWHPYDI